MIRKKPALGLDPRVETGFPKRSCSIKMLARRSSTTALAIGKGIGFRPQGEPDRRSGQIKVLAQTVDQIATIRLRQRTGARAEQHEGRRSRLRLCHVIEPQATAAKGGRRMRRNGLRQEAV